MHFRTPGRFLALASALVLAGCGGGGGGGDSGVITGHAYKGPVQGASICVYALDNGAAGRKGARIGAESGSAPTVTDGCVVTGSDGAYSIKLPSGTRGDLLVESSGGTYCVDESTSNGTACSGGGTPVAMGSARLRAIVAAPDSGTVNAPLTLLTTAASTGTNSFGTNYATIAAAFGVSTDASTSPTSGALAAALANLSAYVGTGIGDFDEIVAGIASGALVPATTTFPAGVELAVGAAQDALRVFKADAISVLQVSTASLPGIPGSYVRADNTVTVTMPGHGLRSAFNVRLTFEAGTGGTATSGMYPVTVIDDAVFTVTDTAAGAIAGGKVLRDPVTVLSATYTQVAGESHVTATIPAHGLEQGDDARVQVAGTAEPMMLEVESVLDANTVRVALPGPAAADASGTATVAIGANYSVYDTVMHPSGKWLYATSGYDCATGNPFCWGGGVITTYRIEWNRGRLVPVATTATSTGNRSMPVKLAIHPAGDRLVHMENNDSNLVLWSLDASTGALSRIAQSNCCAFADLQFSANGQYLYSGTTVFAVGPATITRQYDGSNRTSSRVIGDMLFSVEAGSGLAAYTLADPVFPVETGYVDTTADRDLASRDGSLFVASGLRGIKSFRYAAGTFTPVAELQRSGAGAMSDNNTMYRTVAIDSTGKIAVASYFRTRGGYGSTGTPSGFLFATVGTEGQLARIADMETATYARTARFIKQP